MWGETNPGVGEERGRWSLMGRTVLTGSRGRRRPPRGGEVSPRGLVRARRPVFPGRTVDQKSRRVIARLRLVGGGAVMLGRGGDASVTGWVRDPASRIGEAGGEGEVDPSR